MSNKKTGIASVILFGLVACILYGVGGGIRSDIGILLNPLVKHCNVSYANVCLCIAVMQIVFGITQPLFGIIAYHRSNRLVLFIGAILIAASMGGMLLSNSFVPLLLSLGILFGAGSGALAFGLILTSAIHFVGQKNAIIISGMLNAAAGMMGFVLSPLIQGMLNVGGIQLALTVLAGTGLLLIPVSIVVTSRDPKKDSNFEEKQVSLPFHEAFHNRTYLLLIAGFSTCGFHMVIIESHLFSQYISYGITPTDASWAFSVYGIATILGALLSGFLCTRMNKGRLLCFYYGFRAVWVLAYLFLMPKTLATAFLFAIGLGMTGDATVSPTSGLVSDNFHLSQVAILVGILFFCHQTGAFLSAYLGGALLEATGGYQAVWLIDVALCVFASIMSYLIRKQVASYESEMQG